MDEDELLRKLRGSFFEAHVADGMLDRVGTADRSSALADGKAGAVAASSDGEVREK